MEIVLGRVGHYHVPAGDSAGSCQTAIVAFVHDNGEGAPSLHLAVNVAGFEHDGEPFRRLDVPVAAPSSQPSASFHLTRDCPYGR